MLILGIILIIVGYLLPLAILTQIGYILVVLGIILFLLSFFGLLGSGFGRSGVGGRDRGRFLF